MRRNRFAMVVLIGVILFSSCNNEVRTIENNIAVAQTQILQQEDGTISLKIDKAECYHDMINPTTNTAEWSVVVSKSGRFNVWLSSATKDTTDLKYKNSVLLSVRDERLESRPVIDRLVQNSSDVSRPYYRADSFMGSLYLRDTGVYNIQVISDKIIPMDYKSKGSSSWDQTKLLSVSLLPVKH